MKNDDERIAELEEQIADLRERLMGKTHEPGDAAKLANAITQSQHILTGIQHLKLQRLKYQPADEPLDKLSPDELEARADKVVAEIETARAKRRKASK